MITLSLGRCHRAELIHLLANCSLVELIWPAGSGDTEVHLLYRALNFGMSSPSRLRTVGLCLNIHNQLEKKRWLHNPITL